MLKVLHEFIEITKRTTNTTLQKQLIESRMVIANYWLTVAIKTADSIKNGQEWEASENVLGFYREDDSIFASVGTATIEYGFAYQGSCFINTVSSATRENCFKKFAEAIS
jgi:hypothetical protein